MENSAEALAMRACFKVLFTAVITLLLETIQ